MVLWPQFTIFGDSGKGSTFGAAWDIYIADHANSNMESYAFLVQLILNSTWPHVITYTNKQNNEMVLSILTIAII